MSDWEDAPIGGWEDAPISDSSGYMPKSAVLVGGKSQLQPSIQPQSIISKLTQPNLMGPLGNLVNLIPSQIRNFPFGFNPTQEVMAYLIPFLKLSLM